MPSITTTIKIINKVLAEYIGVIKPMQKQDDGSWRFRGCETSLNTKNENGEVYTIYPIPINPNLNSPNDFYLSMNVSFNEEEIESINIRISRDDKTKIIEENITPTELLMRAEWDNKLSHTISSHAQPHWHIHSYKIDDSGMGGLKDDIKKIFLELKEADTIEKSNILNQNNDIKIIGESHHKAPPMFKFHLAMLAEWDKKPIGSIRKTLDNTILESWLKNCLNYIKNQLEYILKKTS